MHKKFIPVNKEMAGFIIRIDFMHLKKMAEFQGIKKTDFPLHALTKKIIIALPTTKCKNACYDLGISLNMFYPFVSANHGDIKNFESHTEVIDDRNNIGISGKNAYFGTIGRATYNKLPFAKKSTSILPSPL